MTEVVVPVKGAGSHGGLGHGEDFGFSPSLLKGAVWFNSEAVGA